jgi:Tol biopolymer transport system component
MDAGRRTLIRDQGPGIRDQPDAVRHTQDASRFTHHVSRFTFAAALLLLLAAALLSGCDLTGRQIAIDPPTPTPAESPVPTDTPGPSPTPDALRGDDIVYLRRHFESLSGDVWLVHTDHSQPRQLTNLTLEQIGAHSEWPVWKPDRRAIAFASDFRDAYNIAAWNIFTADLTGTGSNGVTQLTSLPLPDGNFFPRPERTIPGIRTWLQVTPRPGGRITGRVLQDGRPAGGATVTSGGALTYTITLSDGTYILDDVPAGASWVKASQVTGADWTTGTVPLGGTWQVPDLHLDSKKASIEYGSPGWDPDGSGLWVIYTARWLDAGGSAPHFEPQLMHMRADGSNLIPVYTPQNGSLGPPRVNPHNPGQVAIADGTELVLLATDLVAGEGERVRARQLLVSQILRDSPLSWSPTGDRLYFTVLQGATDVEIRELTLATGAVRTITTFTPYYQPQPGFDTSPDGQHLVYEQDGDLYLLDLTPPGTPAPPPLHITYFGGASRPTWSGR